MKSDLFTHAGRKDLKRRYSRVEHGGTLARRKRKNERPLSRKYPLHLVLKSSQAKGTWSFQHSKNRYRIEKLIRRAARRYCLKFQDIANVGNHLHLKVRANTRKGFQDFLRFITGQIARVITGARRGFKLKRKFWDELAYTRVVKTWAEQRWLTGYFVANTVEFKQGRQAREEL